VIDPMTATRLRPLVLAVVLACSPSPDAEPPPTISASAASTSTIPAGTTTMEAGTTSAAAPSMHPFPPQSDDVHWPTEEWVVAEWPSQVDKTIVDEATESAFAV
jgi:hypothetical protein